MESLIKRADIYNNGGDSILTLLLFSGRSVSARLDLADLKDYLSKKITPLGLSFKYFREEEGEIVKIR